MFYSNNILSNEVMTWQQATYVIRLKKLWLLTIVSLFQWYPQKQLIARICLNRGYLLYKTELSLQNLVRKENNLVDFVSWQYSDTYWIEALSC